MNLRMGSDFVPPTRKQRPGMLRTWERLLFIFGIIFLGTFLGTKAYTLFYQAYAEYSFDQMLSHGTPPTLRGFFGSLIRRPWTHGKLEARDAQTSPERSNPFRDLIYAPDGPDSKSWSRGRLRAYEKSNPPAEGSVLGRLEIPSIDLSVMLLQGTDDWTLNRAVGHINGTALPGYDGNIGVAGHRDGFFRGLKGISKDDTISLITLEGKYIYRVKKISIVAPDETNVLGPTGTPSLTLVTCYPFYYVGDAPKRFIVSAELMKTEGPGQVAEEQEGGSKKQQ
jgi:sortase A